ncbi:MAG: immunoglobulin-like domain-containing protein, partial [Candidatus Paceibacterota bacterium]
MTERKNNKNTYVDYAFKTSIFAVAFSIILSLFVSINGTKNIAYATVVSDVSSPECQVPEIISPLDLTINVVDINSTSNSNLVYQIKSNLSTGVTYGVNGGLPLGVSFLGDTIYGNPSAGKHSIQIFAQNNCGKNTKTLNIDISEIEKGVVPAIVKVNEKPTIGLVGSNLQLTTGEIFTDPGATANDLEDGIITNKIVITGTVDTNTVGTYTLTYTV